MDEVGKFRPPTPIPGKGWSEFRHKGWTFVSRSHAPSVSHDCGEGAKFHAALGTHAPLPEMTYIGNFLELRLEECGFTLRFDTEGAMQSWAKRDHPGDGIPETDNPYGQHDWTMLTDYMGKEQMDKETKRAMLRTHKLIEAPGLGEFKQGGISIPEAKLREHGEIQYYDMVRLYEDELGDRGITNVTVKIRVMSDFFLILLRCYCRVDGHFVRLWDTRVFHEFGSSIILRDHQRRFADVNKACANARPSTASMVPHAVSDERYAMQPDIVYDNIQPNFVDRMLCKISV